MYHVELYARVRPGLHGGRDERSGKASRVFGPAPGHGAQDAGLVGTARLPAPGATPTAQAWALHRG